MPINIKSFEQQILVYDDTKGLSLTKHSSDRLINIFSFHCQPLLIFVG